LINNFQISKLAIYDFTSNNSKEKYVFIYVNKSSLVSFDNLTYILRFRGIYYDNLKGTDVQLLKARKTKVVASINIGSYSNP
jgi:hypothetical protein